MAFDRAALFKGPILTSVAFAALGWVLLAIGLIVIGGQGLRDLEVFYLLVVVLGVIGLIAYNQSAEHRLAIVAFVAIGFNFVVGLADVSVQVSRVSVGAILSGSSGSTAGFNTVAAGSIMLSFSFIYWIVVFGSGETSPLTAIMEKSQGANIQLPSFQVPKFSKDRLPQGQTEVVNVEQQYHKPYASSTNSTPPPAPAQEAAFVVATARANYAYVANPKEVHEISFTKGQVMEILDNKGNWWRARYTDSNGSVISGVIPSNYVLI
ncbi:UNVERIFIED_CONTAM: Transmembrane osmosensor [Siphonaria sp. JEL0065]|nr:Transmembrane osmosensor [Siphonaria sp. JEL0065]